MKLNSFEKELLEEFSTVNEIANNALSAAYGDYIDSFNGVIGGAAIAGANTGGNGAGFGNITSKYSMHPLDILKRAGLDPSAEFEPPISRVQAASQKKPQRMQAVELPSLEEIQSMYGAQPRILGLDRCEEFRATVKPEHRLMGPAGLFNSVSNKFSRVFTIIFVALGICCWLYCV